MESSNASTVLPVKRKSATEPEISQAANGSCCNRLGGQPRIAETCFNFLTSGVPARVMFYNNGGWQDFPGPVVQVLAEGFQNEKSSIRFSVDSEPFLLDFLSMFVVNLRTRTQRPVAWIDKAGRCFFPTVLGHDDDDYGEWNLGSSTNSTLQTEARAVPLSPQLRRSMVNFLSLRLDTLARGTEEYLSVQRKFLVGMTPFARPGNIMFIRRYDPKDNNGLKRKETFEKLIGLTEGERGNANVQYAWYGATKIESVNILVKGFGTVGNPTEGILGSGSYLSPEERSFASVKFCDVDGEGMQHTILCRVILGNMEQVQPGSKQYYPSSGDFDSGVDDLSNPRCYVVWPTHMSTYVHPEYFISFKLAPEVRKYLFELNENWFHLVKPVPQSSSQPAILDPRSYPASSWIAAFKLFFENILGQFPPFVVELLLLHYHEMKSGVISCEQLVSKVRVFVGDQMLVTVLDKFGIDPSIPSEGAADGGRVIKESTSPLPELNGKKTVNHLAEEVASCMRMRNME